jgi:hypothetical protein
MARGSSVRMCNSLICAMLDCSVANGRLAIAAVKNAKIFAGSDNSGAHRGNDAFQK